MSETKMESLCSGKCNKAKRLFSVKLNLPITIALVSR